jgi:hypothetical protein
MRLQFHHFKLLAICVFAVSCSRTQINFDDPSVLRGAWIAIMGESPNEKTIPITFNATQNCSNNESGQACDAYTITGQALINGKSYKIKGSGTLGLSSPPAVNYGSGASADILDGETIIARTSTYDNNKVTFFETSNAETNQIPKNGFLKRVTQ